MDILITNKLVPVLLEVNHNPSLHASSSIDERIKTRIVRDIFRMLGTTLDMKKKLIRYQSNVKKDRIYWGNKSKRVKSEIRDKCINVKDINMSKKRGGFE